MRDVARDFARGISVCEMEFVNHVDLLAHAPISSGGLSYADSVMPMFCFISGMSTPSLGSSLRLVGLGLAYNTLKGQPLRPFGVLQRLGLSQSLLALAPSTTQLSGFSFPLGTCAIWLALCIGLAKDSRNPFYPPVDSAQTRIDQWLCRLGSDFTAKLGVPQAAPKLYKSDYDPEGLLGVLTTAISMWFGRWCLSNQLSVEEALITGISLSSFGYMFAYAYRRTCPISKPFWTLSFTLSSSGISLLKYTLYKLALPFFPTPVASLLECLGQKSLECFFFSAALDRLGFHTQIRALTGSQCLGAALSTVLMGAFSWVCVQNNLSLRF